MQEVGGSGQGGSRGAQGYEVWFEGWEGEMGGKVRLEAKFDPAPG